MTDRVQPSGRSGPIGFPHLLPSCRSFQANGGVADGAEVRFFLSFFPLLICFGVALPRLTRMLIWGVAAAAAAAA